MLNSAATDFEIGGVDPGDRRAALALLFQRTSEPARAAQVELFLGAMSPAPLEGLFAARRGTRVVGAGLASASAGRVGWVWPPELVENESEAVADELSTRCDRFLAGRGARIAQAIVETDSGPPAARLVAAGYRRIAELLYLTCPAAEFPAAPPTGDLTFEPFADRERERMLKVVDQTYVDSGDCPELDGVRDTADALMGYRATGVFDPGRWLFVRHAELDVGCLLVAHHPSMRQAELCYMGLVPSARGRGWGRLLCRQAQYSAGSAGAAELLLAVDAGNRPALAAYLATGFRTFDRRSVYLKSVAAGG